MRLSRAGRDREKFRPLNQCPYATDRPVSPFVAGRICRVWQGEAVSDQGRCQVAGDAARQKSPRRLHSQPLYGMDRRQSASTKALHQPSRLTSPATTLQYFGGSNNVHIPQL
jgi:hypothetical protein